MKVVHNVKTVVPLKNMLKILPAFFVLKRKHLKEIHQYLKNMLVLKKVSSGSKNTEKLKSIEMFKIVMLEKITSKTKIGMLKET